MCGIPGWSHRSPGSRLWRWYLKFDYNVDSLQGTDQNADSAGQGLLEHNRAHLAWLEGILKRLSNLRHRKLRQWRRPHGLRDALAAATAIGHRSGRLLRLPAIITGSSAAVLPEQLACWSYPLANADADQASFNMTTAMLCRIHQSGRIDKISADAAAQVLNGIRVYKEVIRKHIPQSVPFYPLGMPDVTDRNAPGCARYARARTGQRWLCGGCKVRRPSNFHSLLSTHKFSIQRAWASISGQRTAKSSFDFRDRTWAASFVSEFLPASTRDKNSDTNDAALASMAVKMRISCSMRTVGMAMNTSMAPGQRFTCIGMIAARRSRSEIALVFSKACQASKRSISSW